MECDFCKKTFSSKGNLIVHQNSAKYCLSLQGKDKNILECEYCNKNFTLKQTLLEHYNSCKEKQKKDYTKDYEIEVTSLKEKLDERERYITKLEEKIDSLQKALIDIASQPKSTTTNHNNTHSVFMNKFDINDTKQIGDVLQKHLTKDVIAMGQEGIAVMLGEHLLRGPDGEPLYECTDVARQKFEFVNADGNIETDPKAVKLIRSINKSGLCQKASVAANELWSKDGRMDTEKYGVYAGKVTEVMQLEKDSSKLRNKLASVTARQKRVKK
jgi:hypothetical protein